VTAVERYTDTEEGLAVFERRLDLLERTAGILARSQLVPRAYRGKPQDIMAAGLSLIAVGVEVSPISLKHCFVLDGSVNFDAQLQISLASSHGHQMWFEAADDRLATCCIQLDGQARVHRYTYTIDMARRAGLLDEWVEGAWVEGQGKKVHVVGTDGVRNNNPVPDWAKKLVESGAIKRKDPWFGAREAMLMCRAATLAISKTCPGVMFGMGAPADGARPAPAGVDIESGEIICEDADIVDADIVDADIVDDEPDEGGLSPEGAARLKAQAVRAAIHAAKARIPAGQWKAAAAAAWRRAGLPEHGAHDLADDQVETATLLVRQYLVLAALDAAGIGDKERRHAFVGAVTDGATDSTKALTKAQYEAILAALEDGAGEPEPDLAEQLQASLDAVADDDPGRPFDA
jgi:hypothetical protein